MLKKIALKSSKKLILDHVSDLFQLKADFVAYPSGLITALIHVPVETKRFKLYKYISTPIPTAKNYQFVVETDKSYLAINSEATLFTTFPDLTECLQMRDIYICTHLTILQKSDTGVDCLFDLYHNQFAFADKTCGYKVKPATEAVVRISDSDIFVYSPNTTTLTSKCPGQENKLYNKGASILSLGPGCVVTTTGYVFKRNKQIGEYETKSILVDSTVNEMTWKWISETQNEELETFLESIANENTGGMKVTDIKEKFNLHKLHKVAKTNKFLSWGTMSTIALIVFLAIAYLCRNHLLCGKWQFPTIPMMRANENPSALTEFQSNQSSLASSEILLSAPNVPTNKTRRAR